MPSHTPLRHLLLVVPAILLAACAQNPQTSDIDGSPRGTGNASKAVGLKGGNPSLGSLSIDEPARLKGLTSTQVRQVLGQPGFQRQDAPAEIWQYRGRACILDVYLYDQGQGQTVEHWAVRSPARLNDADCFQQLVAQGHPQPGS